MAKLYLAFVIFVLGLLLAGLASINGQWFTALSLALAGIYCCLSVLFGPSNTLSNPMFNTAAVFIGALGLIGGFLYHRALNSELRDAHAAAFTSFANMSSHSYCRPMSAEIKKITEFGLRACSIQDSADQLSLTTEVAKGIYFGPALSIADSAYTSTLEPPKDNCAFAFKAAFAICPDAFHSLSEPQTEALLKEAAMISNH